jgi:hypothetical protein
LSPARRRALLALWILLGALLVLRTAGRDRGVITDHLEFGRRLFAGEALYAPYLEDRPLHPVYPPSFGLLTGPFSLLPERGARIAWGLAQVAALAGIGLFLSAALRRAAPDLTPRIHLLLGLTAVLAGRYLLRDTHGGGGNLINLALALGAFDLAERRRDLPAALLLGASLATKPTTALLVPVLLVMGHARLALAGTAAALGLVGLALAVHGQGLAPLRTWAEGAFAYATQPDLFAPPHLGLPPFTWMNQCLRCAVARYLGEVPAELAAQVPGFVQGAGWPPAVTAWIARGLGASVLVATLAFARRARGSYAGRLRGLAAGLCAGLLLSPISWKAHHTALIPAFFLLLVAVVRGDRRARALAVAYFLLCVAGGGDLVGEAAKEWQQSLYLATFGTLALLGSTVRRDPFAAPPSSAG